MQIQQLPVVRNATKCNLVPQGPTFNVGHSLYYVLRPANLVDQDSHGGHDTIEQPKDESARPVRTGVDSQDCT